MLKIVVFDTGYGGELFADRLKSELPVAEIIRVIDWRNAEKITNRRNARQIAEVALRPYFGRVDLIVIANYFVSATSLKYFRRKYKTQKFIGFTLAPDRIKPDCPTLILTTKPTTRSLAYLNLKHQINSKTICLDNWPQLIDDGELTNQMLKGDLEHTMKRISKFSPKQVLLACGQFTELTPEFRKVFGHNTRIVDSFDQTIKDTHQILRLKTVQK